MGLVVDAHQRVGADVRIPLGRGEGRVAQELLDRAQIRSGPVVLAIEDTAHLHGMLRTGERIAAALEAEIVVLLVAGDQETLANMEAEVRLALGHRKGMTLAPTNATYGDIGAVAEALRRLSGSFAIAQYGGATVPARRSLRPLMMSLECPLLLVK